MCSAGKCLVLFLAIAATLAGGCRSGNDATGKIAVYPVAGRLIVSGIPAAHAQLAFHPVDIDATRGISPVGVTDSDGRFRLTSYAQYDGAPAGEYIVTVLWLDPTVVLDECDCPDLTIHDRLHGLYCDRKTSTLRATVHAEDNAMTLHAAISGGRGWNLPRAKDTGGPR